MSGKQQNNKHVSAKTIKKEAKKIVKVAKLVTGSGDYRPTSLNRVRGSGDYFSDAGASLGRAAGNVVGGLAGKAWDGFKNIFGFGDYRTLGPRSNSLHKRGTPREAWGANSTEDLLSFVGGNRNPMSMGGASIKFAGGSPRVTHREFVGPVMGGLGFQTKVYRIQPGLRGVDVLFPWGSSVSQCFQQYVLHGAILEYHSTSSDYTAAQAQGSVYMSTLYDASESPLASVAAIGNNDYTTTDKPSRSFIHPLELAVGESPTSIKYVRTSNSNVSATDERLDDIGTFQISTNGLVADQTVQIGELWISYDVEFLKPALPDTHVGTTFISRASSVAAMTLLPGQGAILHRANSFPAKWRAAALNTLDLPLGYNGVYMCIVQYTISVAGFFNTGGLVVNAGNNISGLALMPAWGGTGALSVQAYAPSNGSGASTIAVYSFSTIAEVASENYLTFSAASTASLSSFTCSVVVIPLDNDFGVAPLASLAPAIMDQFTERENLMQGRLDRLEKFIASHDFDPSTSSTPAIEEKGDDCEMERSVHITRGELERMLHR